MLPMGMGRSAPAIASRLRSRTFQAEAPCVAFAARAPRKEEGPYCDSLRAAVRWGLWPLVLLINDPALGLAAVLVMVLPLVRLRRTDLRGNL